MEEATRKEIEALRAQNTELCAQLLLLREEYLKLHDAADEVSGAALGSGICKPAWRGEGGEHRMIVAARPLRKLNDVLLGTEEDE